MLEQKTLDAMIDFSFSRGLAGVSIDEFGGIAEMLDAEDPFGDAGVAVDSMSEFDKQLVLDSNRDALASGACE